MDGPRDYHTKWRKSDRERQYHMMSLTCGILKKWYKWTYLQDRNRLTDRHRKQTYGYQRGKGGRDKLGVWD